MVSRRSLLIVLALLLSTVPTAWIDDSSDSTSRPKDAGHTLAASLALTYTSNWDSNPQDFGPNDTIVGDHVVVTASIITGIGELEPYETLVEFTSGFLFETTQELVIPDAIQIEIPPIDPDQYAWVVVKGIKRGDLVRVVGDFTNNDSDFFAWDATVGTWERTYANNLLGFDMASENHPEVGSFMWTSRNDTMLVACSCYDHQPGNFTLTVDTRVGWQVSNPGSSVSWDTYSFLGANQTTDLRIAGECTEGTYELTVENVTICNFFAPQVSVQVNGMGNSVYNISWSSTDPNSADVNYYAVTLQRASSTFRETLASNLTQCWLLWDSWGYETGEYFVMVEAFSLDFTTSWELAPDVYWPEVEINESTYWPGDSAIGRSRMIDIGDTSTQTMTESATTTVTQSGGAGPMTYVLYGVDMVAVVVIVLSGVSIAKRRLEP